MSNAATHNLAQRLKLDLDNLEQAQQRLQVEVKAWQNITANLDENQSPGSTQWLLVQSLLVNLALDIELFSRSGSPEIFEKVDALVEKTNS